MRNKLFSVLLALSFLPSSGRAATTDKQLYAASMENDAQFIDCVGNTFFAVADFQRVIIEDLRWEQGNSEYEKIKRARESFKRAAGNLSVGLNNSDKLLGELSAEKKQKFERQLEGFKTQVKGQNTRLDQIVSGIDHKQLPKVEEIHQLLSLAIAGAGFGMDVSKKNAKKKTGK